MSTESTEKVKKAQPGGQADSIDPLSMLVNKQVIATIGQVSKDKYIPGPLYMAMEDITEWIRVQCVVPSFQALKKVKSLAESFEKKHGKVFVSSNFDGTYFLTNERLKIFWELGTKTKKVIVSSSAIVEHVTVQRLSGNTDTTEDGTATPARSESSTTQKIKTSSSDSTPKKTKSSKKQLRSVVAGTTKADTKSQTEGYAEIIKKRRGRPPKRVTK